jgi:streptomycin 6-kinase
MSIDPPSTAIENRPGIALPAAWRRDLLRTQGEAGRAWLGTVPATIADLCDRWSLTLDGSPWHGWLGLVLPVRREGEPLALKISWPDPAIAHEAQALAAWDGRGAVRLHAADAARSALLMERLDRRSLEDVPIDDAIREAGRLIRRLAIPAPDGMPPLATMAERLAATLPDRWLALGKPLPERTLARAAAIARELGPDAGDRLVHHDLHFGNVLAGQREPWLAIDPKVVAGDPEYGVAQLLWTRFDDMPTRAEMVRHLDTLIELGGLDAERTRLWSVVRAVDYHLWAVGAGLTIDPARCAAILGWLDA